MKYLEGSLATRQPELPLKLNGWHARRLTGNQTGCPAPGRERRVRALHGRTGREAGFASASPATRNTRAGGVATCSPVVPQ